MATQPRKDAPRLARPAARYWKGKAPKGVDVAAVSDSDEDEEKQEEDDDLQMRDVPLGGQDDEDDDEEEEDDGGKVIPSTKPKAVKLMNVALRDVKVEDGGKVIVGGKLESGRTAMEESEDESGDEKAAKPGEKSSSEYESSSEEESSEEEEEKPKLSFRPVFVPKRGRETVLEREEESLNSEAALEKKRVEEEQRKKDSHDLVAESIKRELAEKQATETIPDIDDTDGLDPEAEFEAWRLRELSRIKRDKEAQVARELEREEIERRRAMPEEQRLREDLERAQKLRDEKPKGQQKFLQKYYHKGAFHQDEEILKKHDYTQATVSTIDISLLPKVMQVKNFGKRSQTKYTHLADQDTTMANKDPTKPGGPANSNVQCFLCGGPHVKRDCPQYQNGPPGTNGTTGSNNASAAAGHQRKWGVGSRAAEDAQAQQQQQRFGGWKNRDGDGERGTRMHDRRSRSPPPSRGKNADDGDRRRPRSRSRSPPSRPRGYDDRDRRGGDRKRDEGYRRRSRSRSRERERPRDEKRQRVN